MAAMSLAFTVTTRHPTSAIGVSSWKSTRATIASAAASKPPGSTAASSPTAGKRAVNRRMASSSDTAATFGRMQGVIKSYDPGTGEGTVVRDTDREEVDLAPDALVGSIFRMLRHGQRVIFDLDKA